MSVSRFRYVFFGCLFLGCVSGVPELDEQVNLHDLRPPAFSDAASGFYLHDKDAHLDLTGTLLIWDNDISVDALVYVSQVAHQKRLKKLAFEDVGERAKKERRRLDHNEKVIENKLKKISLAT